MASKQKTKAAAARVASQVSVETETKIESKTETPLQMDREILKQCTLYNGMSQEQIEKEYLRVVAMLEK